MMDRLSDTSGRDRTAAGWHRDTSVRELRANIEDMLPMKLVKRTYERPREVGSPSALANEYRQSKNISSARPCTMLTSTC